MIGEEITQHNETEMGVSITSGINKGSVAKSTENTKYCSNLFGNIYDCFLFVIFSFFYLTFKNLLW